MCAGKLAVLFYGTEATVFKPNKKTIYIDGSAVLIGSLDKEKELYTVNVHGRSPSTFQRGNTIAKNQNALIHAKSINHTSFNHARNITFHRTNSINIRAIPALINYYHMTMGAPPISTWLNGIDKGWFTSFSGLTSARIRQYCTNKIETAKGHLKLCSINKPKQETAKKQPAPSIDAYLRAKELNQYGPYGTLPPHI